MCMSMLMPPQAWWEGSLCELILSIHHVVVWFRCPYIFRPLNVWYPFSGPVWIGLFIYMVLLPTWMCTVSVSGTHGSQKRALDLWELELQMWAIMWVLGIEFSSGIAASTLNSRSISSFPGDRIWKLSAVWALSSFCCLVCPPFTTFLYYLVMVMDSYLPAIIS